MSFPHRKSESREGLRIQHHLEGALALLDARDVSGLYPAALMTRALLRAELHAYKDAGVFPKNHDFEGHRPSFIDSHGTRCAMACLMELGGAADLVAEVARDANHAFVEDLAADPRFLAWLDAAGLTVAEAERIQPTYRKICESMASCLCKIVPSSGTPAPGAVVAVILGKDAQASSTTARVETVFGDAPLAVGDSIAVAAREPFPVGERYLVFVQPPDTTHLALAHLETRGLAITECLNLNTSLQGGYQGSSLGHTTADVVADLRTQPSRAACQAALIAKDANLGECPVGGGCSPASTPGTCFGPDPVNPVDDIGRAKDSGTPVASPVARDASVGSGAPQGDATTASSAPKTEDAPAGCEAAPGLAGPGSVAVLLAVIGSMLARRRIRC